MNTFAVLLLCAQACLVQNVFGQCLGGVRGALGYGAWDGALGYGALGYGGWDGALGYGAYGPAIAPAYAPACAAPAYGGEGVGNVAVAGDMAVGGTTVVAGQVPIVGAVTFGGDVPAAGAVSIAGRCGCGCGAAPYYI